MAHSFRARKAHMSKNEKTSLKVASLAGKVLSDEIKPTPAQVKTLAGAVLTQAPDKKK
jgi:hypothetical protein